MSMNKQSVKFKGKEYFVENNELYLSNKGITDIADIKGLSQLHKLKSLWLHTNQITEIEPIPQIP